jgi:hypothetical protein
LDGSADIVSLVVIFRVILVMSFSLVFVVTVIVISGRGMMVFCGGFSIVYA